MELKFHVCDNKAMSEHELDVTNNNLVDYNDGYEFNDEIDDMIP